MSWEILGNVYTRRADIIRNIPDQLEDYDRLHALSTPRTPNLVMARMLEVKNKLDEDIDIEGTQNGEFLNGLLNSMQDALIIRQY